ncbi:MAG: helix-turn-helix domain-containing protein [Bacteroidetes bacterium]|nr:helix-turn-helix domain-containing protein [Bacteroidota bacterium]
MSKSNFRIKRICQQCGKEFEAQKFSTKYCNQKCAARAYKFRMRKGIVEVCNNETEQIKNKPIEDIKAKEFLTVRDCAKLLNASRQSIHNLIKKGTIRAVNLQIRKTLIQRSEIDKLFAPPEIKPQVQKPSRQYEVSECYSIQEVQRKYKISSHALYQVIKRKQIPKFKQGWYSYVPKIEIEKLFSK